MKLITIKAPKGFVYQSKLNKDVLLKQVLISDFKQMQNFELVKEIEG